MSYLIQVMRYTEEMKEQGFRESDIPYLRDWGGAVTLRMHDIAKKWNVLRNQHVTYVVHPALDLDAVAKDTIGSWDYRFGNCVERLTHRMPHHIDGVIMPAGSTYEILYNTYYYTYYS